jgi:predicted O-linked N-acetylglucosamine transferase (SPINDLY family)
MTPPDARHNIETSFASLGVPIDRLMWAGKQSWKSHLLRLGGCDLALDTFTYGAHTTASDALWMGVPLVTMESVGAGRMPSRVAASIAQALDNSGLSHILLAGSRCPLPAARCPLPVARYIPGVGRYVSSLCF